MPTINFENSVSMDVVQLHKMAFVYNAVNSGWKVELRDGKYVFSKRHEGKKEIFLDSYLENFIASHADIEKLL